MLFYIVFYATILIESACTYDPSKIICPWSIDHQIRLVFDGEKCVYPSAESFSCPKSDGYFRCPESKSKYYICRNGIPSLESCPKNSVFDGKDMCTEQTFRCPTPVGKFRYPRNTRKYYQCWYDKPLLRKCSKRQYFDGRECITRVESRPVVVRQQRRELFQCPADNGVYPDQLDNCCFWVCRNRQPTHGRCPPKSCGCVNTWRTVSGTIIYQDNGNQIVDTWNTQTHEWDRSYRMSSYDETNSVRLLEQRDEEHKLVYSDQSYQNDKSLDKGIPGYPVLEGSQTEDSNYDNDDLDYELEY